MGDDVLPHIPVASVTASGRSKRPDREGLLSGGVQPRAMITKPTPTSSCLPIPSLDIVALRALVIIVMHSLSRTGGMPWGFLHRYHLHFQVRTSMSLVSCAWRKSYA